MKSVLVPLLLAAMMQVSPSLAMPILSPDGSSLTGVGVGGVLYDVTFSDGVIEEVYAGITFDLAYQQEANAVSSGLAAALNGVGAPLAGDIAGCENPVCLLFVPDEMAPTSGFIDNDFASRQAFEWATGGTEWAFPGSQDSGSLGFLTLVTFQRASVPAPASVLLLSVGLACAGLYRRRWKTTGLPDT